MAAAKNIQFYATLGLIAAGGAGLAWFCSAEYGNFSDARATLRKADAAVAGMLAGAPLDPGAAPVSLTEANVVAARADHDALVAQQAALRNAIAGEPENQIKSDFSNTGSDLSTLIQQDVARWRSAAAAKDIRMPKDEVCFGFRRYIRTANTQPMRRYKEVDRQRLIIGWLFNALLEARASGGPLLLQSIDREPIETYPGPMAGSPDGNFFTIDTPDAQTLAAANKESNPDEFVLTGHSFRRPGLVGSLAFRIRFVGKTDTLRGLLNVIQSSHKPIVVTEVVISAASEEMKRELLDNGARAPGAASTPGFTLTPGFGALAPTPTAPEAGEKKPERPVVIKDSVSEYVVHLEYIFPFEGTK